MHQKKSQDTCTFFIESHSKLDVMSNVTFMLNFTFVGRYETQFTFAGEKKTGVMAWDSVEKGRYHLRQ